MIPVTAIRLVAIRVEEHASRLGIGIGEADQGDRLARASGDGEVGLVDRDHACGERNKPTEQRCRNREELGERSAYKSWNATDHLQSSQPFFRP